MNSRGGRVSPWLMGSVASLAIIAASAYAQFQYQPLRIWRYGHFQDFRGPH